MTNRAKICTYLLFYAYVGRGIHQVRMLVFDNYQTCPVPLKKGIFGWKYTQYMYIVFALFYRGGVAES